MLVVVITDIQFSAAHNEWPALRDAVQRAEGEGYDTTWVFDHFDGTILGGDRPMLECFTLLGALADATSTIGLGTLVWIRFRRFPPMFEVYEQKLARERYFSKTRFTRPEATIRSRPARRSRRRR